MKNLPAPPSSDDLALIAPAVTLPLVIAALKRDRLVFMEPGLLKTPSPYTDVIDTAIARATADLDAAKRDIYRRGLRVVSTERVGANFVAHYLCRGHSGEVTVDINGGMDVMRAYLTLFDNSVPAP
ncbi:hypothetical protein MKX34_23715 [Paenibacillus sp. FSL R5-0636]|uniref:hypothetical protein n=1 Tax=Paenibacillus TaxID=44249 RepID=UPI00096C30B4|nr:hypothetical protein [Paenibacillus odorifer]OMC94361.1 hypothetical protein BJP46_30365 [Paenibacillus odorifer]OMC96182.1 hypothetical protein BJP49_10790 [Paenibacillus odorifer]